VFAPGHHFENSPRGDTHSAVSRRRRGEEGFFWRAIDTKAWLPCLVPCFTESELRATVLEREKAATDDCHLLIEELVPERLCHIEDS
jgi:hypothetical protein